VCDLAARKAAHHHGDGIYGADVREKLVSEALTLAGAAHQAGDVDYAQGSGHGLLRLDDLRNAP
jgi:hypothetical protein